MTHLNPYLHLSRHQVFYLRIRIPSKLRIALNRSEFRKSLNTSSLHIATTRATLSKNHFDKTIKRLLDMQRKLSPETFNQIALEFFEFEMEHFFTVQHDTSDYQNESLLARFEETMQDFIRRL